MRSFVLEGEPLTVKIDFKGNHFPKSVILYAVFFYVRYGVSYRDLGVEYGSVLNPTVRDISTR